MGKEEKKETLKLPKSELDDIRAHFKILGDDELEHVSGGFKSDWGYSRDYNVSCPCCGNANEGTIERGRSFRFGRYDSFYCEQCRNVFGMDDNGWVFQLEPY